MGELRLIAFRSAWCSGGARQNESRLVSWRAGHPLQVAPSSLPAPSPAWGALLANHTDSSARHDALTRSGEILIMVNLGGVGTLYGAIVRAATLQLLRKGLAG